MKIKTNYKEEPRLKACITRMSNVLISKNTEIKYLRRQMSKIKDALYRLLVCSELKYLKQRLGKIQDKIQLVLDSGDKGEIDERDL